ncbi:hypothetical protein C8Q79DRAFT_878027, partial [Trametes meyenii]
EHCHAVPLSDSKGSFKGSQTNMAKKTKNHVFHRCKMIKYPGPEGSELNHKKLHCADGARQASKMITKMIGAQQVQVTESPPMYPQPAGVFTRGTHFHVRRFIRAIQDLYERIVVQGAANGSFAMEDLALASLLQERLVVIP